MLNFQNLISNFKISVAPTSIELVDHRVGSVIEVNENEELEVKCKVSNAKPAADIRWFKDDIEIHDGKKMKISLQNISQQNLNFSF